MYLKSPYNDMRTLRDLLGKGDFFFKVDLKSGYQHLDILESHQMYLGFSWIIDRIERLFVFTVLVFRLASVVYFHQSCQSANQALERHGHPNLCFCR